MTDITTPLSTVLAYHERTKHRLDGYAKGPEALDWDAQPNPFREFSAAPRTLLPLRADDLAIPFSDLSNQNAGGNIASQPLTIESLGVLLELSFALSAWKEYGPDRWALRCNPSSGNLHPTEAYAVCRSIQGITDGLYHYVSRDHALELRCHYPAATGLPTLHIGLSSIVWREAWKYGERAFRYCQHDTGHAIGALRYAAAALGWQMRIEDTLSHAQLAHLLGLDRDDDFAGSEAEEAELLMRLGPLFGNKVESPCIDVEEGSPWFGRANLLDPQPMYRWPQIDMVTLATRKPATVSTIPAPRQATHILPSTCITPAATIIRQRRSAQYFDSQGELRREDFYRMLGALLPQPSPPWDIWPQLAFVHPIVFVHRVTDLEPGIYALPRDASSHNTLRMTLQDDFVWEKPDSCPVELPLYRLTGGDARKAIRTICCHQDIAANAAFAIAMLADFNLPMVDAPWRYRHLHWEAGFLGQVLYLEAEAAGVRATGIGCYFDDVCHELLGQQDRRYQSIYHFTVGTPLADDRILSLPPYSIQRVNGVPAQ